MTTEISKWKAGCGGSRTSGLWEGVWKHVRCTGAVRHAPIPHAQQIESFFGSDKKLSAILIPHVAGFLKSDALLKLPNGKDRSEPTVRKTVRVLRMFLFWAEERGYIEKTPLPKDVPIGRSIKNEEVTTNVDDCADDTAAA